MGPSALASLFMLAAVAISAIALVQHLRHYSRPRFQVYILRILFMVPVYSIQSWLSLTFPRYRLPLSAVRDCYEAYVLYQFFVLLTSYVGGEASLLEYLEVKPNMPHPWPLTHSLKPIPLGRRFLRRMKQGILQFVIVRPACAMAAIVLEACSLYDDSSFALNNGFVYLTTIVNISMTVSLYCLVLFYMAAEMRLDPFRPLPKFLCIKAVLFFSFWQSCALAVLAWFGVVRDLPIVEADLGHAATLQDFLICVEMVFASVAHHYAFSYRDFEDDRMTRKPLLDNLMEVLDVHDVLEDAHESFLDKTGEAVYESELSSMSSGRRDDGL